MKTTCSPWIPLAAFALAGFACNGPSAPDADADPTGAPDRTVEYRGQDPDEIHRPDVDPAILWLTDEDDGRDESFAGVTVPVKGKFPRRFRLNLDDPPPEGTFFESEDFLELVGDSGLRMAIGTVVAAREGLFTETPTTVPASSVGDEDVVRGQVEAWQLLYLNQDVQPGPVSDQVFGGETPTAGYHLLSTEDGSEAPRGLATRLRIVFSDPS